MVTKDNNVERDLKRKLGDFYETHPVAVWGNILFIIGWFLNMAVWGSKISLLLPFAVFAMFKAIFTGLK